jgi:nucleoside-diphosphate-sugar epimerase
MGRRSMSAAFPAYAGVRVLVFGATGFIGRWVARLLTEAGADLWLGVRDTERAGEVLEPYGIKGSIIHASLAGPGAAPHD